MDMGKELSKNKRAGAHRLSVTTGYPSASCSSAELASVFPAAVILTSTTQFVQRKCREKIRIEIVLIKHKNGIKPFYNSAIQSTLNLAVLHILTI